MDTSLKALSVLVLLGVARAGIFDSDYGLQRMMKEMAASTPLKEKADIRTEWMEQPLDHFDPKEQRTWDMRYFVRSDLHKPGGPLFVSMGGEEEASDSLLKMGTMHELSKELGGASLQLEHRYYGLSTPAKEFTFLSSKQALADAALVVRAFKAMPVYQQSKVVVFGGSYAGNLAAWMKGLYPDLVDAALASSAPVLAKRDFSEYVEQVSYDYKQYGTPGCLDRIEEIFQGYEESLRTPKGTERLKKEQNICENTDMQIPENRQLFFMGKIDDFMKSAQYGNVESIRMHCEALNDTSKTYYFKENRRLFWSENENCHDYNFAKALEEITSTQTSISWNYQMCTEFGYFQSTTSDAHPFSKNVLVQLYQKICVALFGAEFDETQTEEAVARTNAFYGGLKPNVSQVVFVNGELDPWHRLGVLEDLSDSAPSLMIPRSSHCKDLFSDSKEDDEELKLARAHIKYLIKTWIGSDDESIDEARQLLFIRKFKLKFKIH